MKKIICALLYLNSIYTFADLTQSNSNQSIVFHSNCEIASIEDLSHILPRLDIMELLRQKNYSVSDDISIDRIGGTTDRLDEAQNTGIEVRIKIIQFSQQKPPFDVNAGFKKRFIEIASSLREYFFAGGDKISINLQARAENLNQSYTQMIINPAANTYEKREFLKDVFEKIPVCQRN